MDTSVITQGKRILLVDDWAEADRHALVSKKFALAEYLRHSFNLFKGNDGDEYEVVMDLDACASDEVRGQRWHTSQELN